MSGGRRELTPSGALGPQTPPLLDGTTRLRRNLLLQQIDARHERIDAMIRAETVLRLAEDFARKGAAGRSKALSRLRLAFRDARFAWASAGRPAVACWAYLKNRHAETWTGPEDHPRDRQRCVVINFLIIGALPNGSNLISGRWTLEITDHCVARLCSPQRSPLGLTAEQTLWAAHDRLLRGSIAFAWENPTFLLDLAGDGGMVVEVEQPKADPTALFAVCRSWLAAEMVETSYLPRLLPAADLSDAIGSFWLCPPPLRRYRDDGRVDIPLALATALSP
jgi:hypothetical protein